MFYSTEGLISYSLATHCADYIRLSANLKSTSTLTKCFRTQGENKQEILFGLDDKREVKANLHR